MRRHGLTLIELLAATVLLAVLAAAILPLLERVTVIEPQPEQGRDATIRLARKADELLAKLPKGTVSRNAVETAISAAGLEQAGELKARIIDPARETDDQDHVWVFFEEDDEWIARWIPVAQENEQ